MSYEAVLDALGDRTRRRILDRLRAGPMPVSAIADGLPVSRPAVSRHLRVLLACGLVRYEEQGTRNLYRIEARGVEELRGWVERFWDDVLGRFADHVEGAERPSSRRRTGGST